MQEFLVTHEKIPIIITNLITTEVWKDKVFPHIIKKVSLESSFQLYMMVSEEKMEWGSMTVVVFWVDVVQAFPS